MRMSNQAAEPELEFHYFEASLYLGSVNVSCFFFFHSAVDAINVIKYLNGIWPLNTI